MYSTSPTVTALVNLSPCFQSFSMAGQPTFVLVKPSPRFQSGSMAGQPTLDQSGLLPRIVTSPSQRCVAQSSTR
jgi:hypothetical protein